MERARDSRDGGVAILLRVLLKNEQPRSLLTRPGSSCRISPIRLIDNQTNQVLNMEEKSMKKLGEKCLCRMYIPRSTKAIFCALILAALGATTTLSDEIHYMPQCRILDTRELGSQISNGVEFGFKVWGDVGGSQGGSEGCGVPIEASGVMIDITAVGGLGAGHLEVYAPGYRPEQPTARLMYYGNAAVSNELLVHLVEPFDSLATSHVVIRPSTSSVHVVADIVAFTTETNPTFPTIKGRLWGDPFVAHGLFHVLVETATGNDCLVEETCFEVECSAQPGAGEVCQVASDNGCIEIQGYRRPYSSPRFQPDQRLVGTIVRLFPFDQPCPWE